MVKELKLILSFTVLLDAVNGFVTMYLPGWGEEIIPLFRVVLILFYLFMLSKNDKKIFSLSVVLGGVWGSIIIGRLYLNDNLNVSSLFMDGSYVSRLYYFFILFMLLVSLSDKKLIQKQWIFDVLKWNSRLMSVLILIPAVLGIGRQTYEGSGFGNSGFFIANNSTNIVLVASSLFLLYLYIIENERDWMSSVFFFLSIISLVIQGSKTSLLFVFLELLIWIVFIVKTNRDKIIKDKKNVIIILITFFFLIFIFREPFYELVEKIFVNISKLYNRQKYLASLNDGFFNVLLSGRLTFLENILDLLPSNSILFYIFGIGVSNLPTGAIVEMDIIDLYIREGLLGILVTYGVAIRLWYLIISNTKKDAGYVFINIIISILIGYSVLAGHVFIDIMPSSFVVFFLVCGIQYLKKEEEIDGDFSFNPTISK